MDSKILQLIESADPLDRKKAVQMLAKMGGPEAIRYLGIIYKRDHDAEVKDLAVQAGKYIKRQQAKEVAQSIAAPFIEADEDAEPQPEIDDEYEPVVVPEGKQTQAKGMMDRALDLSMHGEKDKAIEAMAKAFKVNPNLRLDTYYMGIAMDVTGLDKNATTRLLTIDEKARKAKNKAKLKNDGSGDTEDVTWETALIDLTLYYVIIAGIAIVGMVLIIQAFTNGFAMSTSCEGCSPQQIRNLTSMVQSFRSLTGVGVLASVLYGLIVAAVNIVILLIYYVFMHLVATMLLGGDGTYRGLIHRGSMPLIVSYGVTGVIGLITIYVSVRELFNPETIRQMSETTMGMTSTSNTLMSVLGLVSTVATIGGSIWFIGRVAQNYDFSWSRGCWTNIITNIIIFAMSCGCYMMVLNSLIGSFMQSSMTPMPF